MGEDDLESIFSIDPLTYATFRDGAQPQRITMDTINDAVRYMQNAMYQGAVIEAPKKEQKMERQELKYDEILEKVKLFSETLVDNYLHMDIYDVIRELRRANPNDQRENTIRQRVLEMLVGDEDEDAETPEYIADILVENGY